MKLHEMLRERAKLLAEARKTLDTAEGESRAMTEEEKPQYEGLLAKVTALNVQIEERQRFDAIATQVQAGAEGDGGGRIGDPLPHQTPEGQKRYSLLRAISRLMHHQEVDGLEGEVSKELALRRGRKAKGNGFIMPLDLAFDQRSAAIGRYNLGPGAGEAERRAFDTTAGAGGIPTVVSGTFIDILRAQLVVRQAGARVMTDMQGAFSIPRQSGTTTAYWLSEGGSPTASNPTVDQVPFTPRTIGAFTDVTRRLAEMINTDAEMFVRDDLAAVVARGIDTAALFGTGLTNQPTGVVNQSGVVVVALGVAGAGPTYDALVALESALANANVDNASAAYITNTKGRGILKRTLQITASTFPIYLWKGGATPLNEYPCYVSNLVPSNLTKGAGVNLSYLLFGLWSDMIVAFWSGMDVIVDPYTGSSAGTVRIVVLQDCDVNIRHPESFAVIKDMVTT